MLFHLQITRSYTTQFFCYDPIYICGLFVTISFVYLELEKVVATITKERASDWDKLALYGLSLSKKDVLYLDRAAMSNEGK